MMIRPLMAAATAALVLAAPAARAHDRDLMTPMKVGPIAMHETTQAELKEMFGDPSRRAVFRVGCSRVVEMRWPGLRAMAYRADEERSVVDVKVTARRVHAAGLDETFRFHTRKGLSVGDSEARLQELYPERRGQTHAGHTHYILADQKVKLMAKVVEGEVVQLEAAPYEFC